MLLLRRFASLSSLGWLLLAQVPVLAQVTEPPAPPTETPTADQRFTCETDLSGEYTVMYRPESEPTQSYAWAKPGEMGGGWTAERRCETISARLEQYRPEGLIELRTSVENGYDIVCATTETTDECRIVFTVPPGQDAIATRDSVFDNLALAENGTATDAVRTFSGSGSVITDTIDQVIGNRSPIQSRDRSSAINLKPFLDPADGGTGEALGGTSGRRLNPEQFR
ncbi:MAG: COP23 domain-containing protein [Cyanobacteria bacterium P01_D01_bin.14]